MQASISRCRFLALLFCGAFPVYLAIRGCESLSDVAFALSSLAEHTEALHVRLASRLAAPPTAICKEHIEPSAESADAGLKSRGRRRQGYLSLPDGLANCINSFEQYPFLADQELERKYARYSKQTPAQKAISNKLGYTEHFEKAVKGIEVNSQFLGTIAQIARANYQTGPWMLEDRDDADYGLADLAIGHLMRDWSPQGAKERQAVFPPILDAIEQHFGKIGRKAKVLVPGSGTGRLASDIADLGGFVPLSQVENTVLHRYRARRHG